MIECPICQSRDFVAGYKGRQTFGKDPVCSNCGSTERHRIMFGLLNAISPKFNGWRALQFAPDCSVNKAWFAKYTGSTYGGENSLNMVETGLPDSSYDIVVANHVLEHVPDDVGAVKELLRVVGSNGVIALTIPTPVFRWKTNDWGYPDPNNVDHYRDYGSDFANMMAQAVLGLHLLNVIGRDDVTGLHDHVYFFSQQEQPLADLAAVWQPKAIPMVYVHKAQ